MRRWRHIPRYIYMQESRLSTSTQYLQRRHRPNPKSKPKNDDLKAVVSPGKTPSQSIQPDLQRPSFWKDVSALAGTRWKSKKLSDRIPLIAVVVYFSGLGITYQFYLNRVPLTGRKQLGWRSESLLEELDDVDRQRVEEIRGDRAKSPEKVKGPMIRPIIDRLMKASGLEPALESLWESLSRKLKEMSGRSGGEHRADKETVSVEELRADKGVGSMQVDGPALEMITSVLNRLVEASGLDKKAWEVRITNEPSM